MSTKQNTLKSYNTNLLKNTYKKQDNHPDFQLKVILIKLLFGKKLIKMVMNIYHLILVKILIRKILQIMNKKIMLH